MHQVVIAQLAGIRQGDQSTLTRAEVRGGGRKPWRQKGSGRARQGSSRAPHWRGGGVALGPKPRSYVQRTPKKMVQLALRSALSDRAADGTGRRGRGLGLPGAQDQGRRSRPWPCSGSTGKILVVLDRDQDNVEKSFRNLPDVHTILTSELNAYDVLCCDWIVFTRANVPRPPRPAPATGRPSPPTRPPRVTSHERPPRRHPPPGREREVLRAARRQRVHVRRPPRAPPRSRSATRSRRSSTSGSPT